MRTAGHHRGAVSTKDFGEVSPSPWSQREWNLADWPCHVERTVRNLLGAHLPFPHMAWWCRGGNAESYRVR